jgi:uncharacterized protein YjbI with pentapeptide repeats
MANEEHLKRLREAIAAQNIAAWNKWREERHIIPLLDGADLRGANLENADLKDADLREASLIEANLTGADLEKAFLSRADLWGANLREANLRRATFWEANLSRAVLTGAKGLSQGQIKAAKTDKDTKLPPGLQRPKHWEDDLT